MERFLSMKYNSACPASSSKCISLRNDIDLRNVETKYKHYKNDMLSVNKEHDRSYLNVTMYSKVTTREVTDETNQYALKYPLCKLVLPQIRYLLRDITIINIKDIPGICNDCKNINSTLQCERCDYILRTYMQEKECYVDHCNKECHEVIAQIKKLISEFEKHEELLKFLKPLGKNSHIQRYETQGTDSDIHGGTQGFRSSCVCEDLVKELQDKLASFDYKKIGKSLIDSTTLSQNISQDQLDRIKDNEKKQKYGSSFIDRKVPSEQMSHDELQESKIMDRKNKYDKSFINRKVPSQQMSNDELEESKIMDKKNKYDKSFIDRKVPSHRSISQDQLEKATNIDRKQKKAEVNKMKDDKDNLKYEFEKNVNKKQIKENGGVIKKSKSYKETTGLNDKDIQFKETLGNNVIEQSKREKKRKGKKQYDDIKENAFEVDLKKIKVRNKSLDQFEKMVLSQKKKRKREQQYNIKKIKIPVIEELPPLPVKIFQEPATNDSGSILECIHPDKGLAEMIEGNVIVHDKRGQSRVEPKSKKPLFVDVAHNFEESLPDINLGSPVQPTTKSLYEKGGLFGQYRLSDRNYIKNGWTVLPTSTFVRRVNVYKMVPADSKLDWRRSHKNEDVIFYETGEVLGKVYDDGLFKWFYRDGNVALDYIDVFDNETKATKAYVIYDTVTKNKRKGKDRIQTLAIFDDKGHGAVYDRFGRIRIKYNQDEGVLFDSHIGAPCHWKWNTLNEPPIIEVVHTSEFLTPLDPHIEKLHISVNDDNSPNVTKKDSLSHSQINISSEYEDKRSEIELNNMIKDHSREVMMNYKPFEIRSKMFKLNEHFSLRMLGQSKIYIMFRDGKISLKLNVGMKLISNEVQDIKGVHNDVTNNEEKKIF